MWTIPNCSTCSYLVAVSDLGQGEVLFPSQITLHLPHDSKILYMRELSFIIILLYHNKLFIENLACARHCYKSIIDSNLILPTTVIILYLQLKKLRMRKVKLLLGGHSESKWDTRIQMELGSKAHSLNYYGVRNMSSEEFNYSHKVWEAYPFFRGRFWLGSKCRHFEGQASDTENV